MRGAHNACAKISLSVNTLVSGMFVSIDCTSRRIVPITARGSVDRTNSETVGSYTCVVV